MQIYVCINVTTNSTYDTRLITELLYISLEITVIANQDKETKKQKCIYPTKREKSTCRQETRSITLWSKGKAQKKRYIYSKNISHCKRK